MGRIPREALRAPAGLGTTIVSALAKQFDAQVELDGGKRGLKISIMADEYEQKARLFDAEDS
ncbi:MAG: hypothetical protein M3Q19_11060 [Pseudomonadota bacterium]|nr:hypothetical protein [Pseudomonadota bacterium]